MCWNRQQDDWRFKQWCCWRFCLLQYGTVVQSECLSVFQRHTMPSSLGSRSPKAISLNLLTLKMMAPWFSKTSGTTHPMTMPHPRIPKSSIWNWFVGSQQNHSQCSPTSRLNPKSWRKEKAKPPFNLNNNIWGPLRVLFCNFVNY